MTFILVYHGSGKPLPADQRMENRRLWDEWNSFLNEDYGIRTASGKVLHPDSVEDYKGSCRGASIIEAPSMDHALELARKCPILLYGGYVEILEEFQR